MVVFSYVLESIREVLEGRLVCYVVVFFMINRVRYFL